MYVCMYHMGLLLYIRQHPDLPTEKGDLHWRWSFELRIWEAKGTIGFKFKILHLYDSGLVFTFVRRSANQQLLSSCSHVTELVCVVVRAKTIKNTVMVNEELTAEEWKRRYERERDKCARLRGLIERYQAELARWRHGQLLYVFMTSTWHSVEHMQQQEIYAQRAQTSADPEDPDFGLWTPRSEAWFGSPPKLYHLVLEPCPTPPKNFVKIRSQVCE